MFWLNEFFALIFRTTIAEKNSHIKFWIFHTLIQKYNTIFFLISGRFKRQSFPLFNVEIWQTAQIRRVVEWLNESLLYHKSVDLDDQDVKCKLHFQKHVTFGCYRTDLLLVLNKSDSDSAETADSLKKKTFKE